MWPARVGDPRRADLDRPGADADLALAGVAVAIATEVVLDAVVAAPAEVGVDLGVEGPLEHPPGALTGELLEALADLRLVARDDRLGRLWGRLVGAQIGRRGDEADRCWGVVRFSHGVSFWGFNNTGRVRRFFVPSTPGVSSTGRSTTTETVSAVSTHPEASSAARPTIH